MGDVDPQKRERFLKNVAHHWGRVLVEATWVVRRCGGLKLDDEQVRARARDLINEAVMRILNGKREWDEALDFVPFMRWTMRSVASAEWKKASRHVPLDAETENPDGSRSPKRQFADQIEPWEAALDEAEAEEMVYEIMQAAEGDPVLEKVVNAYLEDACERPRHVAKRLGLPEKDVYQAQRKIERRVLAARKKVTT